MKNIFNFFKKKQSKINTETLLADGKPSKGYQAGHGSGYGYGFASGGAKYIGGLSGDGTVHNIDNKRTRQNARNAYHDTPEAKALVNRFADTIVDKGLKLDAAPKANILGITLEEAEKWADDVEERFDSWAKSKEATKQETMNFYQAQRLYQIGQQRDNDLFVRFSYSKDRSLANPLQISFIDPNQIRGDSITSTYGDSTCHDGIVRDASGKEKAYKIFQKNAKTCEYDIKEIPRVGRVSGRTMMIHGFIPEYANQSRGYSRLEHILQEVDNMTDYKLSTIKKAISQSQISMYVKPSKEDEASNPFEDIASFNSGPLSKSGVNNTGDNVELTTTNNQGCDIDYEPIPTAANKVPGEIGVFNLKEGEDLIPFENKVSTDNFKEFVETYMSYTFASAGMPIEVALMKFGQNYSASRGALILFWRVAEIFRAEMGSDFLDPTYESWLSEEIAVGRIKAPGFSDPVLKKAWLNANWAGAPMPNIDPMRTAKSEMLYAEMGATSLDRVARDYNGSSGKINRQKLAREYEELPIAKWNRTEDLEDPDEVKGND